MGTIRQDRAVKRPDLKRIVIRDRDGWLLDALAKCRFLTTSQLRTLAFGTRSAANKRLRKLLDAGLIRVWVRDLSRDNLYSLTPLGARRLGVSDDQDPAPVVPRGVDGNLEHLLAINDVRIALALGLPEIGGQIVWWRSDWDLHRHAGEAVIPDALFAVAWGEGGEQVFSLEVDNRTRSPRAFLRKVLRYRSLLQRGRGLLGATDFLTLVVGRDGHWLDRYRAALGHMRLGARIWFANLQDVCSLGMAADIWTAAGAETTYSLRTLAFLPYAKEESDSEASSNSVEIAR